MAEPPVLGRSSLAAARRRALLPRRALLAASGVLALVGVRGLIAPTPDPVIQRLPNAAPRIALPSAAGFAEGFARAYLTWDVDQPQRHAIGLAPFLGPNIDVDAGLPVPPAGSDQAVAWTAAVSQIDTDPGRTVVTVAIATDADPGLRHLAVPVTHAPDGTLAVTDYPAAVAAPALGRELPGRDGDELDDQDLNAVIERALGNYLDGQADNLKADLAAGTELDLPRPRMTLDDVVSTEWAGRSRGRVTAVVVARDGRDVASTLRYELRMVREGRWYVAEINPPLTRKESTP